MSSCVYYRLLFVAAYVYYGLLFAAAYVYYGLLFAAAYVYYRLLGLEQFQIIIFYLYIHLIVWSPLCIYFENIYII